MLRWQLQVSTLCEKSIDKKGWASRELVEQHLEPLKASVPVPANATAG